MVATNAAGQSSQFSFSSFTVTDSTVRKLTISSLLMPHNNCILYGMCEKSPVGSFRHQVIFWVHFVQLLCKDNLLQNTFQRLSLPEKILTQNFWHENCLIENFGDKNWAHYGRAYGHRKWINPLEKAREDGTWRGPRGSSLSCAKNLVRKFFRLGCSTIHKIHSENIKSMHEMISSIDLKLAKLSNCEIQGTYSGITSFLSLSLHPLFLLSLYLPHPKQAALLGGPPAHRWTELATWSRWAWCSGRRMDPGRRKEMTSN